MNNDYKIQFTFARAQEPQTTDRLVERFIARVERAHSRTGGGCGLRNGEFFVETDPAFKPKDLRALLAIWLPHVQSLSVKVVAKATPKPKAGRGGRGTQRTRNTVVKTRA